jgi:hypothetical protein
VAGKVLAVLISHACPALEKKALFVPDGLIWFTLVGSGVSVVLMMMLLSM